MSDNEKMEKLEDENRKLRKIWWVNHGCSISYLYGDDGELQCHKCRVDFRRDSVDSIMERMERKNLENLSEEDRKKIVEMFPPPLP